MSDKKNLDLAKLKQDDEFYTSFGDIAAELSKWTNKLANKNIICPCDFKPYKGIESITIKFNPVRFYVNSVKKVSDNLVFDLFSNFEKVTQVKEISEAQFKNILDSQSTCNFINYLWAIGETTGINSITASGYDIKSSTGVSFDTIDYTKYDLCITNPPFSLYREFMAELLEANIEMILIAPFMNRVSPTEAVPLMERKIYLGYGRHLAMEFKNPTGGKNKKVAVDWLVSWPDAQNEIDNDSSIKLVKDISYAEMKYMTMKDGTKPIHVKSITEIPDTNKWMFTSVAILDHLKYTEYEWYCTGCKKYFNKIKPELNPFKHPVTNEMIGYGTEDSCFHGIIFRKKIV